MWEQRGGIPVVVVGRLADEVHGLPVRLIVVVGGLVGDPPPGSCYSGSYQGDTLQTLSSQGTMPGSVGVCASALLAAGCTKIGDPTSTLAVPYYMASAGTAFLAIQCPTGTMARLNRDNKWVYGAYPNYGGYVWYNGNWAFLESNYNTQLGTLYAVASGTGGAIPVSKTNVIAYNVSTNWNGWAYAASCASHPAWGSTNPGGTLYLNDAPCLTATSGWEADEFDPTCGSKCE